VKIWPTHFHLRDWITVIAVLAAIGFGPAFLQIVNACNMGFGVGGIFAFLCFICVVPVLTFAAGPLKFLAWQLAIISLTVTVIQDNFRLDAMNTWEVPRVAYVFWATGTLLSSPLPAYFFLRSMAPRKRFIFGIAIASVSIAMWLGVKRITG